MVYDMLVKYIYLIFDVVFTLFESKVKILRLQIFKIKLNISKKL